MAFDSTQEIDENAESMMTLISNTKRSKRGIPLEILEINVKIAKDRFYW